MFQSNAKTLSRILKSKLFDSISKLHIYVKKLFENGF